jgi:hypothetical protein
MWLSRRAAVRGRDRPALPVARIPEEASRTARTTAVRMRRAGRGETRGRAASLKQASHIKRQRALGEVTHATPYIMPAWAPDRPPGALHNERSVWGEKMKLTTFLAAALLVALTGTAQAYTTCDLPNPSCSGLAATCVAYNKKSGAPSDRCAGYKAQCM